MEMVPTESNSNNQSLISPNSYLQTAIRAKGELIFKCMEEADGVSIFNKDWWYGRIMEWSMKNEHFKTQMFRFVDVLPYLESSSEVAKHLKEYFAEKGDELPSIFNIGVGVGALAPSLLAGAVKKNVTQMAKMFITGETPQDALPVLKKGRKANLCFTADLLGEATLSEKEALQYQNRYVELINWLARDSENWDHNPQIDEDENGKIPKVNVSVKLTSLYSQVNDAAWEDSIQILKERVRPILTMGKERFVFINIDMEQYSHKDLTLRVFQELMMEPEFRTYPHFGIVIQAYLRDSFNDIKELTAFAKHRGTPFTIRLVKGAYWDYETIQAQQKGWPIPVYTNKKESDFNYEVCTRYLLENYPHIRVAIGSHNVRSIAAALVMAEDLKIPPAAMELQMLFGMAEPIKKALVKQGYRLREYATIGELIPGMAYLVRRLLENTSNESFLRSKFAEGTSTEKLLADPADELVASSPTPAKNAHLFYNEPPVDFAIESVRRKMLEALAEVKSQLGKSYPLHIGKKEFKSAEIFARVNPSHPNEVVGQIHMANIEQAELAVKTAKEASAAWAATPAHTRAELFEKLADLILANRYTLSAWEIFEVGKTWKEADGDITEAIDFCRYYAREMRRLAQARRMGHVPGEVSKYHYQPKGVALVLAPWNFPLAILTGMVTAAAVTGNTVIMKPAEQSSVIAAQLMKLITEAGFPPGVINFLPGFGETVGEYLTGHKDIDLIAFTGSKNVGLHIVNKAGKTLTQQKAVKKCIIEMGGKNAIIIDSDADLDEAVSGVLYSAFGFQGQKCSACSRVIVLEGLYERFTERLIESVRSIEVGFSENPKSYMGPVVDQEAQAKILKIIDDAKASARMIFQSATPATGYFVPATLFADVDPKSQLAQTEIFGPVLAIIRAKNIEDALEIANGTEYALTGGLYSRSPATIEKVKAEFQVGNLYINRGNTGAIVERHPFGGFKMSGVGSKAGGPDYLLQFVDPRVVTENTMRRGFAPTEDQ